MQCTLGIDTEGEGEGRVVWVFLPYYTLSK